MNRHDKEDSPSGQKSGFNWRTAAVFVVLLAVNYVLVLTLFTGPTQRVTIP